MSLQAARFVRIVGPSNDAGPYKLLKVDSDGHEIEAYVLEGTGFASGPMTDGIAIAIPIAGDDGKVVILPLAPAKDRIDGLKEGEVQLKNYKRGQTIEMDDSGNVIVRTPGIMHINPPE